MVSKKFLLMTVSVVVMIFVAMVLFPVFAKAKVGGKPSPSENMCLNVIWRGDLAEVRNDWKPCVSDARPMWQSDMRENVVKLAMRDGAPLVGGRLAHSGDRQELSRRVQLLSDHDIDQMLLQATGPEVGVRPLTLRRTQSFPSGALR